MQEPEINIAQKIKDGSYYQDARQWYLYRYIQPIHERVWVGMLAILLIGTFIALGSYLSSLQIEKKAYPVPIKVENSTDYFSFIQPLARSSETTQEGVARYLVTDYLKTWEEYSPADLRDDTLKFKLKKIRSSSTKDLLNDYQGYMSNLNPYSPVVRFGDHTKRTIKIVNFKFTNNNAMTGSANIVYDATETIIDPEIEMSTVEGKQEKEGKTTRWDATVSFKLPDIETISKTGAPLRFLVKTYKTQPKQ